MPLAKPGNFFDVKWFLVECLLATVVGGLLELYYDANWWPLVDASAEFPSLGLTSCKFLLVRLFNCFMFVVFSSNKFGGSVAFEP